MSTNTNAAQPLVSPTEQANDKPSLMNTYGRLDVCFRRGEGVWLFDTHGNKYLDAISGIGVINLGHAHPAVTKAIQEQAGELIHTSNLYRIEAQEQLGRALLDVSGMDNVFFANSGAEANEAAIKLARLYGNQKGITNPTIITANRSFHGRTMASLSASGNPKIHKGFEPLVEGFVHVDFNDIDAIKNAAAQNSSVVAVMVEPVQGEGGVHIPDEGYLSALRTLCDENDWLLILDEVQTGNGRTGKYFAFQHENLLPDVLTTAKGLGNGMPIGACLAQGKASEVFAPGHHGSTFGGNPLACAAGLAVVNTIVEQNITDNAVKMGNYIVSRIRQAFAGNERLVEARNKGLMIGITLNQDCAQLVGMAKDKGLLINVTNGATIRLLPPLIIQQDEADVLIDGLIELINTL